MQCYILFINIIVVFVPCKIFISYFLTVISVYLTSTILLAIIIPVWQLYFLLYRILLKYTCTMDMESVKNLLILKNCKSIRRRTILEFLLLVLLAKKLHRCQCVFEHCFCVIGRIIVFYVILFTFTIN